MKSLLMALLLLWSGTMFCQSKFQITEKNTLDGVKYGVVNTKTNTPIAAEIYDQIADYSEGTFAVLKDDYCGAIDTSGAVIVPIEYTYIMGCTDNRFFASKGNKWGMLSRDGRPMSDFLYDEILSYQYGVARVVIDERIGYIDSLGNTILPTQFTEGYDCFGGLILVYGSTWESLGLNLVTTDITGKEIHRQDIGYSQKAPVIYNSNGQVVYAGISGEKVHYVPGFEVIVVEKYFSEYGKTFSKVISNNGSTLIDYELAYQLTIKDYWVEIRVINKGWQYGILSFTGEVLLKPVFSEISDYVYDGGTLAQVSFSNGQVLYINTDAECVEFDSQKCPD